MEHVYISIIVSVIYFILKIIIDKDAEDEIKRNNLKDSVYVGIIVLAVLYGKEYFFSTFNGKAFVFTNEPGF